MRILFAHDHIFYRYKNIYLSNGSFSGQVLSRYTEVFNNLTIISRQKEISNFDSKLTNATINNIEFIKVPNFKSIKTISKYHKAKKIIEKTVKQCDGLIARLPSSIGKIAVYYAKKYNKPYLVEVVGCAWDSNINHGSIIGKLIAPFEYVTNRYYIKNSKYAIYITKNFLQKRYPCIGKSAICPNVDIDIVNDNVLETRKNKINIRKNTIKFGLIGSLDVKYKGHKTVIEALSLIKNEIPNFKIEFLGKGNYSKWISLINRKGLTDNVDFIGTLPCGQQVYEWLETIDIILQPSLAEAQGRCIIEAMSLGCPIISSKVGGIVELLDNEYLIKPGDYRSLAKKIKLMIDDKQTLMNQSIRNFNEAKKYYKNIIDVRRKNFLKDFKNECL